MYEYMTTDYIMERMLRNVSEEVDQREGSIIYDALMPCAIELMNFYMELDMVLNETFADTASREYLIRRAAERGILPKNATCAHVKGAFYGGELASGKRFSCQDINYNVIKELESEEEGVAYYELVCETPGAEANSNLGQLTPVGDYVEGLRFAEIMDVLIPGKEEEGDDSLRQRYYSSFAENAFGGNIADYKQKVNDMENIGGVKVYPAWNGGGTVKLVIINGSYEVPSEHLVAAVQDEIDPGKEGTGMGIAPIGHVVTVQAVAEKIISISTSVTCQTGYTFAGIKNSIEQAIDIYFKELAKIWDQQEQLVIRVSQIESRILNVEGVLDVTNTRLDGSTTNLILPENEIPVRGNLNG